MPAKKDPTQKEEAEKASQELDRLLHDDPHYTDDRRRRIKELHDKSTLSAADVDEMLGWTHPTPDEARDRAQKVHARVTEVAERMDLLGQRLQEQRAKAKEFADTLAAASHGNIVAMHNIAAMYLNKEIVPSDEGVDAELQALIWLVRAAQLGHAKAKEIVEQQMEVDIATIETNPDIPPEALVAIQEFVAAIIAGGAIEPTHYPDFYTTQELAAITSHDTTAPGAGAAPAHHAAAAAGPAPAVPVAAPAADLAVASVAPTATVEPAAPHEYGAAAAQPFGHGHPLMGAGADHGGDCS